MNIFEKTAEAIGNNCKVFSKKGVKIHPAASDHEIKQLQRQIRSPMHHIAFAAFPCICPISRHKFNEILKARP
jgi:hypothetical protein